MEQPYLEYRMDGASSEYNLSARGSMEIRHDGYISGTVLVEGLPAPYAVVRLYYRPTGKLLYETRCDAGGNFSFTRLADLQSENHYVVALDPEGGYSYNAKIFDKLKPVSTASWQVRPLSMCGGYCGAPETYHNPTGLSANDALQGLPSNYFTQFNQGFEFHPERLNDGVKLSVSSPFGPTLGWVHGGNQPIQNNNRGINFSLLSAKALGRIQLSATPASAGVRACNIVVSALVFGVGWQVVATQALQAVPTSGDEYGYQTIELPANSPTAIDWRIHLESWAWLTGSWMCGEVKAYEWLQGVDPHWASVLTLVRFDGADGTNTITCEKGSVYNANGNVSIAAASAKYGAGGGKFTGAAGYNRWMPASLPIPDTYLGAEFTFEAMVRFAAVGVRAIPFSMDSWGTQLLALRLEAENVMTLLGAQNGAGVGAVGTTPIAANVWYHMAISRTADGTVRLFVDGVLQSSMVDANNKVISSITIGGCPSYYGQIAGMNGALDEFRITNNVARYVANFTPPTDRFPAA